MEKILKFSGYTLSFAGMLNFCINGEKHVKQSKIVISGNLLSVPCGTLVCVWESCRLRILFSL